MSKATTTELIEKVGAATGVTREQMLGHSRFPVYCRARFAVYYLARRQGHSYPLIGTRMNRDHATVIHGVKRAAEIAVREPAYAEMLQVIEKGKSTRPVFYVPPPPAKPAPKPASKRPVIHEDEDESDGEAEFHKRVAKGSMALLAALRAA
jgi:hypothetical protein